MFALKSIFPKSMGSTRCYASGFTLNRPSPPPLPPKEQQEFEELVKAAGTTAAYGSDAAEEADAQSRIQKDDELHPDARRAPLPEFEGDTNPITGEVGGPKREPLKHGDWSFGGRATDF